MRVLKIIKSVLLASCGHKARSKCLPRISCDASSSTIISASFPPSPFSHSLHHVGHEGLLPCLRSRPGVRFSDRFFFFNYQVSPLPVESSLPPINWDNIKAKWDFHHFFLQPPSTYSSSPPSQVSNSQSMDSRQQAPTRPCFCRLSGPPCSCPPSWL